MSTKQPAAPSGHTDIPLSRPLTLGGAKVSSVRMREPTVNDQLAMDTMPGSDAQKEIGVFANLTELAPADIQTLPLRDYRKLQKAFQSFID
jgi:hypothetical protein